jgi:multidrug efflux pump
VGLSRFFIGRPIFAWVLAIGVMLVGIFAVRTLPIAQFPDVAPPTVQIGATYPGANAEVLESSVTQVIEQQLTALDGMLYFNSSSNANGSVSIAITFAKGINPDTAQVQVQNRVQQALPRLPQQVQQQGVTVTKASNDFLIVVAVYDTTGTKQPPDMADYIVTNFQDEIARVPGVGQSQVFGSQYAMRIWLDPYKLAGVQLMPSDVAAAVRAQNIEVSAGQIGQPPYPKGQHLSATVTAQSRLSTPEQFANIVVKTRPDGSVVKLSDIARIELGNENYGFLVHLRGMASSGMALQLAPGADALKTAEAVKARAREIGKNMPAGFKLAFPRDSTAFIKLSIEEVVKTLVEAVILVVIVMFIFLQSWRATLVPAIAVPVVLLGTFGILALFDYTINTLTMFGLVLSIGLLVDDAIVVVENVERIMEEEDLSPREATEKSMAELGSALVGIAIVLSAVLLPMAFFGGSTGVIYRQFSVTIVSSMLLSVLVALILSPAICATLLKKPDKESRERHGVLGWFKKYGDRFNDWFGRQTERYVNGIRHVVARKWLWIIGYVATLVLLVFLFVRLPTGFLPTEDQGQVIVQYTLPAGANIDRSEKVEAQIADYMKSEKDIEFFFQVLGFSLSGSGQNAGIAFILLNPFDQRHGQEHSAGAIAQRATMEFQKIRDAQIFAVQPPPIQGFGQTNGFTFELLNSSGMPRDQFKALRDKLIGAANTDPMLAAVRSGTLEDTPQLHVTIDQQKLAVLGLSQSDVNATLSGAWGSSYINDFVDRGRVKRVFMQGDADFRALPSDLDNWFVRASNGTMVPFASFATTNWTQGPATLSRFNGRSSYELQGQAGPGYSSGDAMKRMTELAAQVAPGTSVGWAGLSFEEQLSSGQGPLLYGISAVVVFLALAALYESWTVPLSVLLVVPLGMIGTALAVTFRGLENNIYFQVGLLTTMGLAAKNAILIVEFAELAYHRGLSALDAATEAGRIRLRPIIMTSIAFMAGVVPLAIASGAGAQSRIAIGTAVLGGMFTATVLAIFFVPLFFVLVIKIFGGDKQHEEQERHEGGEAVPT